MPLHLLILIAGLTFFSVVHSLLAADSVREWVTHRLGWYPRSYRRAFNLLALALLAGTLVASQGDYPIVWRMHGYGRAALLAIQAVAVTGFILTFGSFNKREFIGLRDTPAPSADEHLRTGGMYRLCRHPLYFFTSLFFSAWPTMDLRWFVFAMWLWAYSYLGSIFEERKLVRIFGADYRAYQATHPRLLPLGARRFDRV